MDDMSKGLVTWTLFMLILVLLGGALSGCGSTTGWGVGFNVYPVTQMRNVQSLQGNQSDARIVKRSPAPKSGASAEEDY